MYTGMSVQNHKMEDYDVSQLKSEVYQDIQKRFKESQINRFLEVTRISHSNTDRVYQKLSTTSQPVTEVHVDSRIEEGVFDQFDENEDTELYFEYVFFRIISYFHDRTDKHPMTTAEEERYKEKRQRRSISGTHSLNEKDLQENLAYFKVPPSGYRVHKIKVRI